MQLESEGRRGGIQEAYATIGMLRDSLLDGDAISAAKDFSPASELILSECLQIGKIFLKPRDEEFRVYLRSGEGLVRI